MTLLLLLRPHGSSEAPPTSPTLVGVFGFLSPIRERYASFSLIRARVAGIDEAPPSTADFSE